MNVHTWASRLRSEPEGGDESMVHVAKAPCPPGSPCRLSNDVPPTLVPPTLDAAAEVATAGMKGIPLVLLLL